MLECVVEEPEKAQNFLLSLTDSGLIVNKFTESIGITSPCFSLKPEQDISRDDIRLILSRIENTLDVIQDIINDLNKHKKIRSHKRVNNPNYEVSL